MTKQNIQKVYSPCKGNCACARDASSGKDKEKDLPTQVGACAIPKIEIVLDKEGNCPCGKVVNDCCHKDAFILNENDALYELCAKHALRHLCG